MKRPAAPSFALTIGLAILFLGASSTRLSAADAPAKPLLILTGDGPIPHVSPSSGQVSIARSTDPAAPGAIVTIKPGPEGYPGISVKPDGAGPWDLSAFGHVKARVVNTGEKPLILSVRVDNAGDWQNNPWNTESLSLKPGSASTITVVFGFSSGHKPGYVLKPGAVTNVLLFAGKSDAVQSFRIESLSAEGEKGEKPPVDPETVAVKPAGGMLLGGADAIDLTKQVTGKGAPAWVVVESGKQVLRIAFPAAKDEQSAALKPAVGRWDLRDCLEARVKLRNAGKTPVAPRIRLESNTGPTDWASTAAPLAPGAAAEIIVPFAAASIWNGGKETGSRFASNVASAVTFSAEAADGERVLIVDSIRASMPPAPPLPAWLGKRPPTEGEWTKTFNDDFDAAAVDSTKWNFYGENHWDKTSHFSKETTFVSGGAAHLRFQKKRGFHNDDPKRHQTDYATGFLDTLGKWSQRYGYFESRMKVPTAPGLWPAFWMMPYRTGADVPKWKRQDTADGGMEFDIMEHLTRWGPTRYNIAMHWDGYGKTHKSTGSEKVYVQPDADGFITAGMLWTPGSLVFYGNGREVARWENPRVSNVPGMMMFTLPAGGWDNDPLDDARLPADFVIDYVRVWQRRDLASDTDGSNPATRPAAK